HRDLHSFPTRRSSDLLSHLDRNKYQGFEIHILKEGWFLIEGENRFPINRGNFSVEKNRETIRFDVVVNVIHGTPGEDGQLQAYRSEEHTSELQSRENL